MKRLSLSIKYNKNLVFHLMLLPAAILVFIYCYLPLSGLLIAFEDFKPSKGFIGFFTSKWVGMSNFIYLFHQRDAIQAIYNTMYISFMKMVLGVVVPVIIAILLNEITSNGYKRTIQTMVYLPNFISWVVLGGVFVDILSPEAGIVNEVLKAVGIQPIFFLGDNKWFPYVLVATDVWKSFGFGSVIYLASITGIDPTLYEAAVVDGAGHYKRAIHITLPCIMPMIILMSLLSLGNLLNAGFDQVFNMYNPAVYESGDIIDTLVYRIGLVDARYNIATAVGMFKSVISIILISASYYLAYRIADYRIF